MMKKIIALFVLIVVAGQSLFCKDASDVHAIRWGGQPPRLRCTTKSGRAPGWTSALPN
jgi:hypothetical protein